MAKKRTPATKDDDAEMTAKAAEAFAMYVAMGPGRSLTNLAHILTEQNRYKTRTTARNAVATWSARYRWQERIASAVTAQGEELLAQITEFDIHALRISSELLYRQILTLQPSDVDEIIKIRQMVRRPEPRGGSESVNVNLAVTLRTIVEQVAAEEGLDPEQVLAQAEKILASGG